MEVILKEDVEKLGPAGGKVKVRRGYGRNYLIPQGLAMEATAQNLKALEQHMKTRAKKLANIKAQAEETAAKVAKLRLVFVRKVGEEGKLFGSVTVSDIGHAIIEKGVEIDRRKVLLDVPLKTAGEHRVKVKLHPEVTAEVLVEIRAETEETPLKEEAPEEKAEGQTETPAA